MLRTNGHHKLKKRVILGNQGKRQNDVLNILKELSFQKPVKLTKNVLKDGKSYLPAIHSLKNLDTLKVHY